MSELRLILLGAPGAGKGTQAKILVDEHGLAHISTGDILRAAVKAESDLGKMAKDYMDKGELVPDSLIIDLMRERLAEDDCKSGFLLDGFPRTLEQGKALDGLLEELNISLSHVVLVKVDDDELLKRIENRAAEGSGRSDDNIEVAKNRLEVYRQQTEPLVAYYADKGLLKSVDGIGSVEEVSERVGVALS